MGASTNSVIHAKDWSVPFDAKPHLPCASGTLGFAPSQLRGEYIWTGKSPRRAVVIWTLLRIPWKHFILRRPRQLYLKPAAGDFNFVSFVRTFSARAILVPSMCLRDTHEHLFSLFSCFSFLMHGSSGCLPSSSRCFLL